MKFGQRARGPRGYAAGDVCDVVKSGPERSRPDFGAPGLFRARRAARPSAIGLRLHMQSFDLSGKGCRLDRGCELRSRVVWAPPPAPAPASAQAPARDRHPRTRPRPAAPAAAQAHGHGTRTRARGPAAQNSSCARDRRPAAAVRGPAIAAISSTGQLEAEDVEILALPPRVGRTWGSAPPRAGCASAAPPGPA